MSKTNVRIKKAELSDIDILNKISVESKMYWNYPQEWIDNWMSDLTLTEEHFKEQYIYKLEREDLIIGFCSIVENEKEYEITDLWLIPKYIGKGYGKLLLNETIKRVVKKDKEVIVESDPNSEAFYSSQGFKTFDRKESYPKGHFLSLMKKIYP